MSLTEEDLEQLASTILGMEGKKLDKVALELILNCSYDDEYENYACPQDWFEKFMKEYFKLDVNKNTRYDLEALLRIKKMLK